MTRRIAKVVAWILGSVGGLGTLLYGVLLVVNWNDTPPSEAALRFEALYRDRPAVADASNAYVYALGFEVDPDGDPLTTGIKRKQWLVESAAEGMYETRADPLDRAYDYKRARVEELATFLAECRQARLLCGESMRAHKELMARWLESEQWLLQRYLALLDHPGWRELLFDERAPLLSFQPVMDGQLLLFAKAGDLVAKRQLTAASDLLARDLAFWRRVIESSDNLITKMRSTGAISRHFALGSSLLRGLSAAEIDEVVPPNWRSSITDAERSLRRAYVGEWQFSSRMLRDPRLADNDGANILIVHPYQSQATINDSAEFLNALADTLDVPIAKYPDALDAARELAQARGNKAMSLRAAYNPAGKALIAIAAVAYPGYSARVNDLEGLRRLTLVFADLRRTALPRNAVARALDNHELRNPYTNQPFEWDEKDGSVVFNGLAEGERGRYAVRY